MEPSTALGRVEAELDVHVRTRAPEIDGRPGLIAFSGGPDSTALLAAAFRRAGRTGAALFALHLDHGLDPGSAERADSARRIAAALGVEVIVERREVAVERDPGESLEAAARRVRYAVLRRRAAECGATWIATAHHRDDQAETVVLRLLFGSGVRGLAAMRPRGEVPGEGPTGSPTLHRPLLALPRAALAGAALEVTERTGLTPVHDPTNADLSIPRNLVRRRLLPLLARREGTTSDELAERLASLASGAAAAGAGIDRLLAAALDLGPTGGVESRAVPLTLLTDLPDGLLPYAAALLHARAGLPYPPSTEACSELARQLAGWRRHGTAIGCDCGGGWRWASREGELTLVEAAGDGSGAGPSCSPFSYTLRVPGEVVVPESGAVVSLHRAPLADWMLRGAPGRAGLGLVLSPGDEVTIRSRLPGDRIHPLGAPGSRRIKDLLIDRRVPRRERDRLPLVCIRRGDGSERIAWVPGVAVDESCRLPAAGTAAGFAWVAEIASR